MSTFIRQQALVQENVLGAHVTIIGCGAVGSVVALNLAKMGVSRFSLWDFDRIEEHNLPNQFYPNTALGKSKVEALKEEMIRWCPTGHIEIEVFNKRFDISHMSKLTDVVISSVDSMEGRKTIFNCCLDNENVLYFIDGRMGGHQLEVYTVNMREREEIKQYQSCLWEDFETSPLPCGAQAIIYTISMMAAVVCNQIRLALQELPYTKAFLFHFNNYDMIIDTVEGVTGSRITGSGQGSIPTQIDEVPVPVHFKS